ncbi:Golgi to ER traffic- protein [Serendipita sp. 398]|nr:Golgi to ER traffic- protein [Serendipita sp. 398]
MGGQPGMQDDLFGKLEGMREVINEVNTQFKDPVGTNNAENEDSNCEHCRVRTAMQHKYLNEAYELYDEFFHIIKLPLLTEEVRGPEKLKEFSKMLVEPYKPSN